MRIEIIANAFDHFVAHANRRMLAAAAQPQVAMIHQEIDAVILRRDRIRVFFGNALQDIGAFDIELIAAGRARLPRELCRE